MVARRLLVLLVVAVASCHRQPASTARAQTEPVPSAGAAPVDTRSSGPGSAEIPAGDRRILDAGVVAMEAGDAEGARLIFVGLLDRYPQHKELSRLHAAAVEAQMRAESQREAMRPVALEAVPLRRHKVRDAPIKQGRKPELLLASKARNEITDVDAWFRTNALQAPTWKVPVPRADSPADLPAWIPREVGGRRIVVAIDDQDHAIALYAKTSWRGRVLLVFGADRGLVAAYDFSAWSGPGPHKDGDASDRRILWALVRDGVLFVSSGHFGYAKESGGRTAFLSALDLATGELLWRSDPLVANASNFLYEDGYIISGYGFTAEPDFLFVLDAKTGKTVTKTKLRKGPDYILKKGTQVFVRTYDTDYVFDMR